MATDIIARGIASSKIGKEGGVIDGDLSIGGNLSVTGTTVTTKQETLFVKKNMLVTNADGLSLLGLSGLGIRNGSTDVYGLVYDNSSNSVKFGIGTLDSNNNFTFNVGEGHPIAIRDNSSTFVDGDLVKWNASSNMLVDGVGIDTVITDNSSNLITSGAVYSAIVSALNTPV